MIQNTIIGSLQFKGVQTDTYISPNERGVKRYQRNETGFSVSHRSMDPILCEQEALTSVEPFSFTYLFSQTGELKKRLCLKIGVDNENRKQGGLMEAGRVP